MKNLWRLSWSVPVQMINIILRRCRTWSRWNTAQTGDWRREEGFTDVTLVDKSGTLERKGEGEYLRRLGFQEAKEFRRPARRDRSRSLGRRTGAKVKETGVQ